MLEYQDDRPPAEFKISSVAEQETQPRWARQFHIASKCSRDFWVWNDCAGWAGITPACNVCAVTFLGLPESSEPDPGDEDPEPAGTPEKESEGLSAEEAVHEARKRCRAYEDSVALAHTLGLRFELKGNPDTVAHYGDDPAHTHIPEVGDLVKLEYRDFIEKMHTVCQVQDRGAFRVWADPLGPWVNYEYGDGEDDGPACGVCAVTFNPSEESSEISFHAAWGIAAGSPYYRLSTSLGPS